MIFVEDALGARDIAALACLFEPRHGEEPVEVVARHRGLGGHRRHHLEAFELDDGLLLGLFAHLRLGDFRLELVDLVAFVVFLAELLLDRLHLLVEVVLLLSALHLLAHATLDAPVDLKLVHFELERGRDAGEALHRVPNLEEVLLLVYGHDEVRRNGVGELAGIIDLHRGVFDFALQVARELDVLLEQRDDFTHELVRFTRQILELRHGLHHDFEKALFGVTLDGAATIGAFDENLDVPTGELDRLQDVRHRAHGVDVGRAGVVGGRVVLRGQEDTPVVR